MSRYPGMPMLPAMCWLKGAVAAGLCGMLGLGVAQPAEATLRGSLPYGEIGTLQFIDLFKTACIDTQTDLDAVRRMARNKRWDAITGSELDRYRPRAQLDAMTAWRGVMGARRFAIAYTIGPLDPAVASRLPEFAGATVHSCSLFPSRIDHDVASSELARLAGRAPAHEFKQGRYLVRMWQMASKELTGILYHYRPTGSFVGGFLNMSAILKAAK